MMIKKLRRRLTILLTGITGAVLTAVLCVSMWYSILQTRAGFVHALESNTGYLYLSLSSETPVADAWLTEMERTNAYVISITANDAPLTFPPGYHPKSGREDVLLCLSDFHTASAINGIASIQPVEELMWGITFEIDDDTEYPFTDPAETEGIIVQQAAPSILGDAATYNTLSSIDPSFWDTLFPVYQDPYPAITSSANDRFRVSSLSFSSAAPDTAQTEYVVSVLADLTTENHAVARVAIAHILLILFGIALLALINRFLSKLLLRPTEESLQKQAAFVSAASHELRSPLSVFQCSLSAVEGCEPGEEQKKHLAVMQKESVRMGRLVEDLLMLAGSDSGKWRLTADRFDVDSLLIEKADHYRLLAQKKQKRLTLILPEAVIGDIHGDKLRIGQILSIFLDNALEYAPAGSEISLSAYPKKNKLALSVSDNGPGIPEAERDRIFERFYRREKSRTDKAHFGLGLSIAKELAQLHSGTVSCTENDAGGATFTLLLPKGLG